MTKTAKRQTTPWAVIEQAPLASALADLKSVVDARNTVPILANLALVADPVRSRVSLSGTDMDRRLEIGVDARVETAWSTTLPAHAFAALVAKLPKGCEVRLELDSGAHRIRVSAGRTVVDLPVLPVGDVPVLEGLEGEDAVEVAPAPDAWLDLQAFVSTAVSTEETRYYLNGIFLHPHKGGLRAVATDGHRLMLAELAVAAGEGGQESGIIVPRQTLPLITTLAKAARTADLPLVMRWSDTRLEVEAGSRRLLSKLIDGDFPDYERVIPKGQLRTLRVDPRELRGAVERVSVVTSDKSRALTVELEPGEERPLRLSVASPEIGYANEPVAGVLAGSDAPLRTGFNAKYLLDALGVAGGEEVTFGLGEPAQPARLTYAAHPDRLGVLMPLRV